jgi:mRNA interferase RelE/StbE
MAYRIIWSESASRQLAKLDHAVARRIFDGVERLRDNPLGQLRRLVGLPHLGLRVGDYRIIIEVKEKELVVLVLKVGHRESIHD